MRVYKMKFSQYNIEVKLNENEYLLTNLINKNLLNLNKDEYILYNEFKKNDHESYKFKDTELYNEFVKNNILIEEYANEISLVKQNFWKSKSSNNSLNLTIIPTFECNFKCNYCFQKGQEYRTINEEQLEIIYLYIKRHIRNIKQLNITWYGGEPLLVIDKIVCFSRKIIDLCDEFNVKYNAAINTNGYLLNKENIKKLLECNIKEIVTTLAGKREDHDKLRRTKENQVTFNQIIKNLKTAAEYQELNIIVTINITKKNKDNITDLFKILKENKLAQRLFICFDLVTNYNNLNIEEICIADDMAGVLILELYQLAIQYGINICDPTRFSKDNIFCGSDYNSTISVDGNLNVYKCCEQYSANNRIGFINSEGDLKIDNSKSLCKDPFKEEKCIKCRILPYCYGGCSNKKLSCKNFCPFEKENIEQYLKLYYIKNYR